MRVVLAVVLLFVVAVCAKTESKRVNCEKGFAACLSDKKPIACGIKFAKANLSCIKVESVQQLSDKKVEETKNTDKTRNPEKRNKKQETTEAPAKTKNP